MDRDEIEFFFRESARAGARFTPAREAAECAPLSGAASSAASSPEAGEICAEPLLASR